MTSTTRTRFSLSGPSIPLDARTLAVRGDLADIALAGKLFVPHYARPMPMTATAHASIHSAGESTADVLATLQNGDQFMVVDMSGGWAWGFAAADHIVGYVDLALLEQAA